MPFHVRGAPRGPEERYSGRDLERDLLGQPKMHTGLRIALQELGERPSFFHVLKAVRRNNLEDPVAPHQEFARDLRNDVAQRLGLTGGGTIGSVL
jgi:hypothetical protein